MNGDKYTDAGEYIPGFFCINLDIDLLNRDTSADLPSDVRTTLVHEYIHFLQDISTTSGINQANFLHQRLMEYLHEAAAGDTFINCDIHFQNHEVARKQRDLNDYYNGDDNHIKISGIQNIKCEEYEYIECLPPGEEYPSIYMYYNDDENSYLFGRFCILESMAYLIEKNLLKSIPRINELPYNGCEMMCQYFYPQLLETPNILLAVCELSLMHYNSGLMFFKIITDMKKNNYKFSSIEDFIRSYFCRCDFLWHNYKKQIENFIKTIDALYGEPSMTLGNLNIHLKSIIKKALKKRMQINNGDALFISRLIENPQLLDDYVREFDVPIINGNDVTATGTSNDMLYMKIPYAVFRVLTTSDNQCILKRDCQRANNSLVDETCTKEPWKQSEKEGPICPFGIFWHRFSLEGKRKNPI